MSEPFNPYLQWLGLSRQLTRPNYYELLGIDKLETDPRKIAAAADRATARVRACKPGSRAAAWAGLLDEIAAAKACLTDATQRAAYDHELDRDGTSARLKVKAESVHTSSASTPLDDSPVAAADLPDPMAPFGDLGVDPMAPVTLGAVSAPSLAEPSLLPPLAEPTVVAPSAVPVRLDPMAAVAMNPLPSNTVPMAVPAQPQPVSVAVQPARVAAAPVNAADVASRGSRQPTPRPGVSTSASAYQRSRRKLSKLLIGGGVVAICLALSAGYWINRSLSPREEVDTPPSNSSSSVVPSPAVNVESTVAATVASEPGLTNAPPPTVAAEPAASEPIKPLDLSIFETSEEQPPATPPPAMTEPASEPTPPPPPTAEQLRALAQALTTARQAIAELNLALADEELAKAETAAMLDEHKEKVRRLRLLADYVRRFQAAIDQTLGRLQAGEQVKLDEQRTFGVVEIAPDKIIIRYNGRNLSYARSSLPLGLARRLGEMSLPQDDPQRQTPALLAAYFSVHPQADEDDLRKAAQWWTEAAGLEEVPDLITAIGDDYTLRQERPTDAVDPAAMEKLAARMDRLKDSTRLEDYAREYQSAIDEAWERLEPGMELLIGVSTTVTVQELKPDRVIVGVADLKRGFGRASLPLGLASALAEQTLPKDAPLTSVMKGAYFAWRERDATTKQFRDSVLAWWQAAAAAAPELRPIVSELAEQYPD